MPSYPLSRGSMTVRAYTNEDFEEITRWYNARRMIPVERFIPQYGFIVDGVAAGFLMQTDTPACFLEPFISNPETTGDERDEALNLIFMELINCAKLLECEFIYGVSTSQVMVDRSLKHGFKIQDISTVVRKGV